MVAHGTGYWLLGFWITSNVVSTMPSVDDLRAVGVKPGALLLYKWFHDLLHVGVGNAGRVFPQVRMFQQNGNGGANDKTNNGGGTNGSTLL